MNARPVDEDAWAEERNNLAHITQDIDHRLAELAGLDPATASHQEVAEALQRQNEARRHQLDQARDNPYVGRADLVYTDTEEQDRPRQTIYIGVNYSFGTTIPDTEIVSWTAPTAALFYNPALERISVGSRERTVTVILKRTITVADGQIIRLSEDYRRSVGVFPTEVISTDAPQDTISADAVTHAVSGTGVGDGHLQIIIGTIDPDQYQRIANVNDQVLIVQGSAGSGKSEIGLHRIAYLLSPFSELGDREKPTPDSILFIGPSRSFLEYASDILPQLGVEERVMQTTFGDWVRGLHSRRLRIESRIWNHLLDKGELQDYDAIAESLKGSTAMALTLSRHVSELARDVRAALGNVQTFPVSVGNDRYVGVTKGDIRDAVTNAFSIRESGTFLNRLRRRFFQSLTESIVSRAGGIGRRRPDEARQFRSEIESQLEDAPVATAWPVFDFRQEYIGLLRDPERLTRLAGDHIPADRASVMARGIRMTPDSVEFSDSDRAALTYLDHLLNVTIQPQFKHIVVDEAQDLSPLDFRLLRLASSNGWFTILGDTSQRLMPHRGIHRWRHLDSVLGRTAITVQHARLSYRATKQITRFNNRILRLFDTTIDAPQQFDRDGPRVEYLEHRLSTDMYRGVVSELTRIRTLEGLENARIAILVRDQRNLNAFYDYCQQNGVDEVAKFGEESLDSPTVLARIAVTQGLEYDAVIVLGVNQTFRSTEFNRKLLYLACTRAKHYLALHWSGAKSPILNEISPRGVSR